MTETAEARLKRLSMRSWRRGTKEMDLVFGPWSDAHLARADEATLTAYDRLLDENDQDLNAWIVGQMTPPAEHAELLGRIGSYARNRLMQK